MHFNLTLLSLSIILFALNIVLVIRIIKTLK